MLSTNDETPRDARCNTGRVYLFQKQFTGYIEPPNMLVALLEQSKLHEARQSDKQVCMVHGCADLEKGVNHETLS